MSWLRKQLCDWLGVTALSTDHEGRLKDIEKHFVTKRDSSGGIAETLADVPLKDRKDRQAKLKGLSPIQRQRYLEVTDGGRLAR